ncbi:MAG TPA: hemopexin repeat-containing protein [Chitinophagaceae bacterium]
MKTKPLITYSQPRVLRSLLSSGLLLCLSIRSGAFTDDIHQTITGDACNGWTTSAALARFKPASAYPDLNMPYKRISDAHCDNCDWDGTADWIVTHREQAAIAALRYHNSKLDADYQDFFFHFGFILHAIQDFYAHSNWVETYPPNFLVNLGLTKPSWWVSGKFDNMYDIGINVGIASVPNAPEYEAIEKDGPWKSGYPEAYQDALAASRDEFRIFQEKVRSLNGASLGDTILTELGFTNLNTHKRVCGVILYPSNSRLYFFRGTEYYRFNPATNTVDTVTNPYPRQTSAYWPGVWATGIDSAVTWNNGKIYFFKGEQYIQYDIAADRADTGYPKNTAINWPGIWPVPINAVINVDNQKAYFFKGEQYIRYDIATNHADPGYPRLIADDWPGLWADGVDSAAYLGNGKIYFFKGAFYVRYDMATKKVEFANPLPIADNFKGIEVR